MAREIYWPWSGLVLVELMMRLRETAVTSVGVKELRTHLGDSDMALRVLFFRGEWLSAL